MSRRNSLSAKFALISLLGLGAAFGCSSSTDAPSGFPPEATGTTDEADTAGSCGQASVSAGQTVTYSTPQSLKIPASLPGTAGASSSTANLVFAVGSSTTSCSYQSDGAPTPTLNLKTCSGGQQANTILDVSGIGLCVTNFCPGGGSCPTPCATTSATLLLSVDDGNPCTTDTCTYIPPPYRCLACRGSYVPTHTAGPAGVACPDSNVCNGTEVCGSTGTCLANSGVPISLNNSNPCVSEKCDPTFGVVDTPITTGSCAPSLSPPSPGTVPGNITNQGWPNASQTGICTTCPDAIDQKRIAVIRGRVVDASGNVVPGASVTILNHSGFGQTATRSDGWFDITVNGGAEYTVAINAPGYLPVHRNAATRWLDYTVLQDTKLTPPAPPMTALGTGASQITLAPSQPFQTVIGTTSTDSNGSRTPVLMFPAGTTASWSGQTTTNPIHVHATEFTVGPAAAPTNGADPRSVLSAMPGDLPRTSVYTYSVEFSVDEAGGAPVSFSNPVVEYVENFVGFDMNQNGGVVPNGYYDRARGTWVPLANGQIVQITSSDGNGHAVLASNGALNPPASSDELAALWNIYGKRAMPVSLWRVPLATTPGSAAPSALTIGGGGGAPAPTAPFDQNWGMGCDPQTSGCVGPNLPNPDAKDPVDDPCKHSGSIIECENQILAEEIGIAGTPFFLRYQSERQKGRSVSLDIPVTPSDTTKMPKGVIGIFTDVYVAGTSWRDFQTQPLSGWQPNQLVHWTWDRINGYGQYVSGRQLAHVGIGYVYAAAYGATGSFGGEPGGSTGGTITGNRTLAQIAYWQYHDVEIGEFDAKGLGFGGWSISANHVYDTVTRTFYGGDGDRRRGHYQVPTISTVATGIDSSGVAAAPDGSFYTTNGSQIVHVLPSGSQELIATPGTAYALTLGKDGFLYYSLSGNGVWKVAAVPGSTPINVMSASAIGNPSGLLGVAVGNDGSVFASATYGTNGAGAIWRVAPDGSAPVVVAGGQQYPTGGYLVDGQPATSARVFPSGLAIGPDGDLYFIDTSVRSLIRRLLPNGSVGTIAGPQLPATGDNGNTSTDGWGNTDGLTANLAWFSSIATFPAGLSVGPDGTVYVADYAGAVRAIGTDGIIRRVAGVTDSSGTGVWGFSGDGGPAPSAKLNAPRAVSVGPDGRVYISDENNNRIRMVAPTLPGWSSAGILLPSSDGSEVYSFGPTGQHLATLSPLPSWSSSSNAPASVALLTFGYDGNGLLSTITDRDGNKTSITRPSGTTLVITAPFGQTTTLTLDASTGYLTQVTNNNNETVTLKYDASKPGLLTQLTDPNLHNHYFGYSPDGLLTSDQDAVGGTIGLSSFYNPFSQAREVDLSSATRHVTRHLVGPIPIPVGTGKPNPTGIRPGERRTAISPSGATSFTDVSDHAETTTFADGTVMSMTQAADPVFGSSAPDATITVTTPGGLSMSSVTQRATVPAQPANPFATTKVTSSQAVTSGTTTYSRTSTYDVQSGTIATSLSGASPRQIVAQLDRKQRVRTLSVFNFPQVVFQYNDDVCSLSPTDGCGGALQSITQSSASDGTRTTRLYYHDVAGLPDYGTPSSIVDALGRRTSFTRRDAIGRILEAKLPDPTTGTFVEYGYDANGNATSVATPAGNAHGFNYTPVDFLQTYSPPAGGATTTSSYTLDRNVKQVAAPDGTLYVTYDANGRPSQIADPSDSLTFAYDAADRVTSVSSANGGSLTYQYDGGLLTQVAWNGPVSGTVARAYDGFFRTTSLSVNGGTPIALQYGDVDGLLTAAGAITINRDPTNGTITTTRLGAVGDLRLRNAFGEITTYCAAFNGTPGVCSGTPFAISYGRDPSKAGRISSKTETLPALGSLPSVTNATTSYVYDDTAAGQHNTGALVGDGTYTWGYDADGNRTTRNGATVASYDPQDRILYYQPPTGGTNCYTFSAGGNLATKKVIASGNATDCSNGSIQGSTTSYGYDLGGNLRSVTLPNGTKRTYAIDPAGRRIAKYDGNGALLAGYVYQDALRPIAELDASGSVQRLFVYGSKSNVPDYAVVPNGPTYRILSDRIGSPRLVVNVSTGTIVHRLDYDAWGNVKEAVVSDGTYTAIPFGFAGGLRDTDTGFVRFGSRDYDPETGRWVTKDPSGLAGGLNLYAYALNDPIDLVDLTGTIPMWMEVLDDFLQAQENFDVGFLSTFDITGVSGPIFKLVGVDKQVDPTSAAYQFGAVEGLILKLVGLRYARSSPCPLDGMNADGRSRDQERLRQLEKDPNTSSADRGWIRQEQNAVDRGNRTTIRRPPGKQLAHSIGREAAKGYDHVDSPSQLQDKDLHQSRHLLDDYGRANTERPDP